MAWGYKGEEDWLAIVKDGGSSDEEEEAEEDQDFFGKRGKRSKTSSRRPAKRRVPQYEPVPATEVQVVSQRPLSAAKQTHHDIILAGDVIELDSDDDESLDDLLRHARVDYTPPVASNALAQIRANKAMLKQAQGTHTEVDFNSPAVPRREQGELVQLLLRCSTAEIADVKLAAKTRAPFSSLIGVYASLNNLSPEDITLKLDGIAIDPDSTPGELTLRDGDVVDAVLSVLAEAELQQVEDEDLILKVSAGDGKHHKFRVSKTTSFKVVFDAFCKKTGLKRSQVKFQFDGEELNEDGTPEDEDMESDDIIDTLIKK